MAIRNLLVLTALLGFGALAHAQGGTIKAHPYVPRKIVLSPEPVTRDEAGKVFTQATDAIAHVIPKVKPPAGQISGAKPVTREDVINQFDKMFRMTKPEFKFTPKKVAYDASLLTIKDPTVRAKLEYLIAWGCVDKVGILATSPKDTLGVTEFGDCLGYEIARLAELTHMPDPEFTPDLQP